MNDHRPGYAHGATMPLATARWIATHIVDAVEAAPGGLRLRSAGGSIDVHCAWGMHLQAASDGRSVVALDSAIQGNIDQILAYEHAHPDEPRIGSLRK